MERAGAWVPLERLALGALNLALLVFVGHLVWIGLRVRARVRARARVRVGVGDRFGSWSGTSLKPGWMDFGGARHLQALGRGG